jgi:Fe-S-cluster-containing dehydrogenase component
MIGEREFGIITWDKDRCIGCRYCQVACPYNVPKFQWDTAVPEIVKCELCNHMIVDPATGGLKEGVIPGCCQACPKEAVIFGTYEELLADAKQRLGDVGVGLHARSIQHGIYKGFIAPVALYGILGAVIWRNRRAAKKGGSDE